MPAVRLPVGDRPAAARTPTLRWARSPSAPSRWARSPARCPGRCCGTSAAATCSSAIRSAASCSASPTALVARKFVAAQAQGLVPVLCVGETLEEREGGRTNEVVARQLDAVLTGERRRLARAARSSPTSRSGRSAPAARRPRSRRRRSTRSSAARSRRWMLQSPASVRILYGGSVKASNARELFAMAGHRRRARRRRVAQGGRVRADLRGRRLTFGAGAVHELGANAGSRPSRAARGVDHRAGAVAARQGCRRGCRLRRRCVRHGVRRARLGSFLSRTTAVLATLFFVTSLGLSYLFSQGKDADQRDRPRAAGPDHACPGTASGDCRPTGVLPSVPRIDDAAPRCRNRPRLRSPRPRPAPAPAQ